MGKGEAMSSSSSSSAAASSTKSSGSKATASHPLSLCALVKQQVNTRVEAVLGFIHSIEDNARELKCNRKDGSGTSFTSVLRNLYLRDEDSIIRVALWGLHLAEKQAARLKAGDMIVITKVAVDRWTGEKCFKASRSSIRCIKDAASASRTLDDRKLRLEEPGGYVQRAKSLWRYKENQDLAMIGAATAGADSQGLGLNGWRHLALDQRGLGLSGWRDLALDGRMTLVGYAVPLCMKAAGSTTTDYTNYRGGAPGGGGRSLCIKIYDYNEESHQLNLPLTTPGLRDLEELLNSTPTTTTTDAAGLDVRITHLEGRVMNGCLLPQVTHQTTIEVLVPSSDSRLRSSSSSFKHAIAKEGGGGDGCPRPLCSGGKEREEEQGEADKAYLTVEEALAVLRKRGEVDTGRRSSRIGNKRRMTVVGYLQRIDPLPPRPLLVKMLDCIMTMSPSSPVEEGGKADEKEEDRRRRSAGEDGEENEEAEEKEEEKRRRRRERLAVALDAVKMLVMKMQNGGGEDKGGGWKYREMILCLMDHRVAEGVDHPAVQPELRVRLAGLELSALLGNIPAARLVEEIRREEMAVAAAAATGSARRGGRRMTGKRKKREEDGQEAEKENVMDFLVGGGVAAAEAEEGKAKKKTTGCSSSTSTTPKSSFFCTSWVMKSLIALMSASSNPPFEVVARVGGGQEEGAGGSAIPPSAITAAAAGNSSLEGGGGGILSSFWGGPSQLCTNTQPDLYLISLSPHQQAKDEGGKGSSKGEGGGGKGEGAAAAASVASASSFLRDHHGDDDGGRGDEGEEEEEQILLDGW